MAETLDKFEEDALGFATARIRGARRATVDLGEPIDVRQFAQGMTQPRKAARPLTLALEQAIQALLDGEKPATGVADAAPSRVAAPSPAA